MMQTAALYGNKCGVISSSYAEPGPAVSSPTDESIKTQFCAPEGVYKQMTISEYSRPTRLPLNQAASPISNSPVRVSFLSVPLKAAAPPPDKESDMDVQAEPTNHTSAYIERICFNVGREIYVYDYGGIHNASDLSKPVDKRVYKGTFPTCHDFNQQTATQQSAQLIIGFSAGQIQLIDPYQKEFQSRLFNEDRVIDKSAVTCLKWVPGQTSLFIASHASGNLYVYNDEFVCTPNPPVYQMFKQGEGYSVHYCKTKSPRNPIQKWTIGSGAVNQFDFSCRDGKYLATAGQDGFLRVFNYESMELLGFIKSYFGGLLCLAWSPDLQLIATGGEDDMLTIYSVQEKRVLCRGQGHKSWISQVAFDPYIKQDYDGGVASNPGLQVDRGGVMDVDSDTQDVAVLNSKGHSLKIGNRSRIAAHITPPKAGYSIDHSPSSAKDSFGGYGGGQQSSQSPPKEFNCGSSFANCIPSSSGISSTNSLLIRPHKDSFTNSSMAWLAAGEKATATGGTEELHNNSSSIFGKHSCSSKTCYRIGSVSHDTQICLWELPDDILQISKGADGISLNKGYKQEGHFHNTAPTNTLSSNTNAGYMGTGKSSSKKGNSTTVIPIGYTNSLGRGESLTNREDSENTATTSAAYSQLPRCSSSNTTTTESGQQSKESKSRLKKLHKRGLSFGCKLTGHDRWLRSNGENSSSLNGLSPNGNSSNSNVLTMSQEGFVCTWARPGKVIGQRTNLISVTPETSATSNQMDTIIDGTSV